jgi:2,5-diketo-D-gluconate reductase A
MLADGNPLPAIGFGTYPLRGESGTASIVSALELGYRLIDTAVNYENEVDVGEAIRRSSIPRDDLIVTSKLPGRDHAYDDAVASVRGSLDRLGLERLDLHLIHWPNPSVGQYADAWRALVACQKEGLITSIGVSNFTEQQLTRIIADSGVTPVVNQIELHPGFPQVQMREVNARLGIQTESWSPLGKRRPAFAEAAIVAAAVSHSVTPAQIVLRWHLQLGSIPIPKAVTAQRQRENLDIFGFELADEEMAAITALGRDDGRLFDGDPNTHEEM